MVKTTPPKRLTLNSLSKYKFVETNVLLFSGTKKLKTRYSVVTMQGKKFLLIETTEWKKSRNPDSKWETNYHKHDEYIDINRKDEVNFELELLNDSLSKRKNSREIERIVFKPKSPVKSGRRITQTRKTGGKK